MRRWAIATGVTAVALAAAGAAIANHVTQADPATVPTGFLAAHNSIEEIPLSACAARAVTPNEPDIFIPARTTRCETRRQVGTRIRGRHSSKSSRIGDVRGQGQCVGRRHTTLARASSTAASAMSTTAIAGPDRSTSTMWSTSTAGLADARHPRHHGAGADSNAKEGRDEQEADHDDHAGRCVGNARRNVDGDGRPEDVGPRTTRLPQAPEPATCSHGDTGLNGMMNDRHVFDIMIPLVEASFAAGMHALARRDTRVDSSAYHLSRRRGPSRPRRATPNRAS